MKVKGTISRHLPRTIPSFHTATHSEGEKNRKREKSRLQHIHVYQRYIYEVTMQCVWWLCLAWAGDEIHGGEGAEAHQRRRGCQANARAYPYLRHEFSWGIKEVDVLFCDAHTTTSCEVLWLDSFNIARRRLQGDVSGWGRRRVNLGPDGIHLCKRSSALSSR